MALPATGDTITMTDIRDFFIIEGQPSSFVLGILGTYIGIAQGTTITMSSTFGGLENQGGGAFFLNSSFVDSSGPLGNATSGGSVKSCCIDTYPSQAQNAGYIFGLGGTYSTSTTKTGGFAGCINIGGETPITKNPGKWWHSNASCYAINGNKFLYVDRTLSPSSYDWVMVNSGGTELSRFSTSYAMRQCFLYSKHNDRIYVMDLYDGLGTGYRMNKYTPTGTLENSFPFPTALGSGSLTFIDCKPDYGGGACIVPGMDALLFTGYYTRGSTQYFYVVMFDAGTDTWYTLIDGSVSHQIPGGSLSTCYSYGICMSVARRYIAVNMNNTSAGSFWKCWYKADGDWTNLSSPLKSEQDEIWVQGTTRSGISQLGSEAFAGTNASQDGCFVSFVGTSDLQVIDFETGLNIDQVSCNDVFGSSSVHWPFIHSQRDITTTNRIKNTTISPGRGGPGYQLGYGIGRTNGSDLLTRFEFIVPQPL